MPFMMQCTNCQHRFNKVLSYCPYCGQENNTRDTGLDKKALCPRCNIALKITNLRDNELDICPRCHGMWLDTLEFEHPTTKKQVKFEAPLPEDMQYLLDMLRKYRKV